MIAAAGTVILSLSVMGFGISYNKALKNEKESIDALLSLCEKINTRISCFRQPLNEIYEGFSNPHLDRLGFTDELKKHGLSAALISKGEILGISKGLMAESRRFAEGLGKSYSEEQTKLCERYLSCLKREHDELGAQLPTKTKLSLSLSGAISALTAILFL